MSGITEVNHNKTFASIFIFISTIENMTTVKSQFIDWLHTNQFETQNLIDQYLRLINFSLYYQVGIFCIIHCFVDLSLVLLSITEIKHNNNRVSRSII